MNPTTKAAVLERANERRYAISDQKGGEYSGKADVLRNFKQQSERLDVEAIKVLGVYFGKHIDSIESFMRELATCKTYAAKVALVNRGEGLLSRLDDARNYLDLLECLLVEEELHPEGVDRDVLGRHELIEEAERIDWMQTGYQYKQDQGDATVVEYAPITNLDLHTELHRRMTEELRYVLPDETPRLARIHAWFSRNVYSSEQTRRCWT